MNTHFKLEPVFGFKSITDSFLSCFKKKEPAHIHTHDKKNAFIVMITSLRVSTKSELAEGKGELHFTADLWEIRNLENGSGTKFGGPLGPESGNKLPFLNGYHSVNEDSDRYFESDIPLDLE